MRAEEILKSAAERGLSGLPGQVHELLIETDPPPRLVAHLALVHDVACQLIDGLNRTLETPPFDADIVRFGAATHDIGKAQKPSELVAPGKEHEELGRQFLEQRGFGARLARFAATHGARADDSSLLIEDMLVMLADKAWKAKRDQLLEERLARELADAAHQDFWTLHLLLSDVIEAVADGATERLTWQNRFPVDQR